jgi:hypothetical protein
MDKSQLDSFRQKTQGAFEAARPVVFTYDGGDPIDGSIVYGSVQVELEHGPKSLSGVTITVDKKNLVGQPWAGKSVQIVGQSWEIYEVAGLDSTRWIIRAATFPGDRK